MPLRTRVIIDNIANPCIHNCSIQAHFFSFSILCLLMQESGLAPLLNLLPLKDHTLYIFSCIKLHKR